MQKAISDMAAGYSGAKDSMTSKNFMERMTFQLDNGARFEFLGRLFSEAVWCDEDSGLMSHQKLYVTDRHEQVYVIQRSVRGRQSCRAYRIILRGDRCVMFDGRSTMEMPLDLIMLGLKALCGAEDGMALEQAEEMLRAACS